LNESDENKDFNNDKSITLNPYLGRPRQFYGENAIFPPMENMGMSNKQTVLSDKTSQIMSLKEYFVEQSKKLPFIIDINTQFFY
jgi:hypothetical protein